MDAAEEAVEIEDVFEELEELEELVDTPEEREQVRETMQALRRARTPQLFGRLRDTFGTRDAGEAVLGSVIFGAPMVVEGGTLEIGAHFAANPLSLAAYVAVGLALVFGILHAGRFGAVAGDRVLGVARRPAALLTIAAVTALFFMTAGGRVDWTLPWLAGCQTAVTAVVMAIGAALGDLLPE